MPAVQPQIPLMKARPHEIDRAKAIEHRPEGEGCEG